MSAVPMPQMIEPMLAQLARELPAGEGWAFEHKWDGYRALLYADHGRLRLLSRRHIDYTSRVPELAALAPEVGSRRLILDGELVALIAGGRPSFQALQLRLGPQLAKALRRATTISAGLPDLRSAVSGWPVAAASLLHRAPRSARRIGAARTELVDAAVPVGRPDIA